MKRSVVAVAVAVVAVATTVLAGCGSGSGSGASANPSSTVDASGDTGGALNAVGVAPEVAQKVNGLPLAGTPGSGLTRGVTATSVKVGCVNLNAFFPNPDTAFKARIDRANAAGGVNGRKIDFLGCNDDGGSADANLAISKRLVEQDQVFAMMQFSTFATPQVTDYLNQNEVPFYGWGFLPGFCGTRWGFGFNGCVVSSGISSIPYGWALTANNSMFPASGIPYQDIKVAFIGTDNDSSRSSFDDAEKVLKADGGQTVYNKSIMPLTGVTDYSPYIRPALAEKPNAVDLNVGLATFGQVVAALKGGGYTGPVFNTSGYLPGLLERQPALAAALEGSYSLSVIPPVEMKTPFNDQMVKDFEGANVQLSQATIFAYAQADMFLSQLAAAGPDLNTKTFDQAVNGGGYTYTSSTPGGPASLPFPAGHFVPADCGAPMQVVNKKYVVKGPYKCFTSVQTRP
ncbi:ABC transporter substrate-binding protein [Pseudonocardia oroxyli]|uniref:ABC-type branched-chain amino acid transport system, substrate-binding protein n=1 Tax=Pseudonocardia oroxyli TaxID=366584 RepID=A0A1G7TJI0_PSEOR|nr:ABC transporter substrate-binding protein [Pseudonocardia oroxyli]SDG35435.1 ABC-type branched-chain amino acid transport system, substrate-binding protein [Pseudonocardia oroxyli]